MGLKVRNPTEGKGVPRPEGVRWGPRRCAGEGWAGERCGRGEGLRVEAEGVREGRCCPGGRCVHTVLKQRGLI